MQLMGIFLVIFLFCPRCFSCSARVSPANRAKVVEDYVLSAKFDSKPDLPQLKMDYNKASGQKVLASEKFGSLFQKKDNSVMMSSPKKQYDDEDSGLGDPEHYNTFEDREFMIHYHVPPPHPPPLPHPIAPRPPPPPPPPPPPAAAHLPLAVAFPPVIAVGFMVFLMLLNSLQTTLLLTTKTKSPLGPLKPLGRRRKRFASAISSSHSKKKIT